MFQRGKRPGRPLEAKCHEPDGTAGGAEPREIPRRRKCRTVRRIPLRRLIRRALRHCGADVVRWRPQSSPEAALAKALIYQGIDSVLDVGANEGQYGKYLRELGFNGRIISFEPLPIPHARLRALARKDPMWVVAPRMAMGDRAGQVQINVASNGGASSSIFPMLATHKRAAPEVAYVASETVSMSRLDGVAATFLSDAKRIFIKVDVQGFESAVLKGATEILPRTIGAEIEISFVPLYEGQTLFLELTQWMQAQGFEIWGIIPAFADNSTGQVLQADVVFFKS